MTKAIACLLVAILASSPASAAGGDQQPFAVSLAQSTQQAGGCKSSDPHEVVVCGRAEQRYRIDPAVLAAARAAEAAPARPPLDASQDKSCIGANCGGGTIPLVGIALTVLKAAELAANGDDWREAFRTRPDQYRAYQDAKAKVPARSLVNVGVSARNK